MAKDGAQGFTGVGIPNPSRPVGASRQDRLAVGSEEGGLPGAR
jgi:hypothetical protein